MTERRPGQQIYGYAGELALWVLFFLGLWAPWTRTGAAGATTMTWLRLPGAVSSIAGAGFNIATVAVTISAIVLAVVGAALRLWSIHRAEVISESRALHPRLFHIALAGAWLFALSIAILLPVSSAILFVLLLAAGYIGLTLLHKRAAPNDGPRSTPEPGVKAGSTDSGGWVPVIAQESAYLGFAVCMGTLAWRYSPALLLRALLICLGGSLVLRALFPLRRHSRE